MEKRIQTVSSGSGVCSTHHFFYIDFQVQIHLFDSTVGQKINPKKYELLTKIRISFQIDFFLFPAPSTKIMDPINI